MKLFNSRKKEMAAILKENVILRADNTRLRALSDVKDMMFKEMISDGLRHHSSLAAKHMADRREYLKKKRKRK